MQEDIQQLDADLQRLIAEMRFGSLEDMAVRTIQQRLMMRACADLLNSTEQERWKFIDHVQKQLPPPTHAEDDMPRVLKSQEWPRSEGARGNGHSGFPWRPEDYEEFARLTESLE